MQYLKHKYLNLTFRVDGESVWWWSYNVGVWFPEMNIKSEDLQEALEQGRAYETANPED
ncbi:hypothetical protein QA066_gp28 [Salmonella phage pink]|uniref:Uncharacterized protein n=1 Tax=Salmonella phage pink TaxID=2713312 RepID=A0A6G8R9A0_9CAUD|nr:hypothetical protein QA066_gp28 [Salmonella phage pink]QIN97981.1 hypothetical protein pink_28 [Salmonella phage pink]